MSFKAKQSIINVTSKKKLFSLKFHPINSSRLKIYIPIYCNILLCRTYFSYYHKIVIAGQQPKRHVYQSFNYKEMEFPSFSIINMTEYITSVQDTSHHLHHLFVYVFCVDI